MTAAILSIGTELVRGEIVNTNSAWLCDRLTSLGMEVDESITIGDDIATIVQVLRRLAERHTLLVSTGGLGPTTDDLTSAAVAQALGVPLQRDEASINKIRAYFAKANSPFSDSNAKQADFPAGASVLENNWGTAPGFSVDLGGCRAVFLPGVPREMQPMFEMHVTPAVAERLTRRTAQVRLRTFGASESAVNDKLAGIEAQLGIVIGYRAHVSDIEVKALATRDNLQDAQAAAQAGASMIRERLGDLVYGTDNTELAQALGSAVTARGWHLAVAESCTGGLMSQLLTAEPASAYYKGAIVCYSNDIKTELLGVPASVLDTDGAVSESTVRHMAEGVCKRLGAEVGIAISGIAGPSGGTPEKPVGLVHFAVHSPLGSRAAQRVFSGNRLQIQRRSAFAALNLARLLLLNG